MRMLLFSFYMYLIQVIKDDTCSKKFPRFFQKNKLICTISGYYEEKIKDQGSFCGGDSGGPGVIEDADDLKIYQVIYST